MLKEIIRTVVISGILLLAVFAFFAFAALLLRMGSVLSPYIGGFMSAMSIIAIALIAFALIIHFTK